MDVSEGVEPELLAQSNELVEEAAEYRRQSRGAPLSKRGTLESRRAGYLLSRHLLSVHCMVTLHPELNDEYQEWRRIYPTFTSD